VIPGGLEVNMNTFFKHPLDGLLSFIMIYGFFFFIINVIHPSKSLFIFSISFGPGVVIGYLVMYIKAVMIRGK